MMLAVTESDGFALTMIAILAISMGFVALILLAILRQGRRNNREVEKLLDEVSEKISAPERAGPPDKPKREPWERDSDWWKQ